MNFIENPAFTSAVISEDIILQKIGDQIHISCPVESEGKKKSRYIFGQMRPLCPVVNVEGHFEVSYIFVKMALC